MKGIKQGEKKITDDILKKENMTKGKKEKKKKR